jgi:hypothetical protein
MEEETQLNMVKKILCDKKRASLPSIRPSSFHATFHKDFLSSIINGSDSEREHRQSEVFKKHSVNHALTADSDVDLFAIVQ